MPSCEAGVNTVAYCSRCEGVVLRRALIQQEQIEREQRAAFRRVLDLSGGVQRPTFLGGIGALPGLRLCPKQQTVYGDLIPSPSPSSRYARRRSRGGVEREPRPAVCAWAGGMSAMAALRRALTIAAALVLTGLWGGVSLAAVGVPWATQ